MKNTIRFLGLTVFAICFFTASGSANSSLVAKEWFFGLWDCNDGGRPAKMHWYTVNDPQTTCNGNVCTHTSSVKVVGGVSHNNGASWVPLAKRWSKNSELLTDYWYLNYNNNTLSANGWSKRDPRRQFLFNWEWWKFPNERKPLQCQKISE
ncbi:hypothetical protein WA1_47645 [Scytonema hofmannii PCC 7110]|uniref:Secreted protein n=1 Tax=Scytonema hofmannii PCC 7110 TaxID=128403 RepID=A0A139WXY8_9CYAN|nr:DUF6006 family protein [Scytonema hofmannii]KYC37296.1 hypothetical protein WA1_47645 [Scytonema hofmannii PCC 7110]